MNMRTVGELLALCEQFLIEKGVPSPRRLSQELLGWVLNVPRLELYMQFDRPVESEELDQCRMGLRRLGEHEPWQYLVGSLSFLDATIKTDARALIPRQETEVLAAMIAGDLKQVVDGVKLLDLCTGSGCLAIALKLALPQLQVTAVDLSGEALSLARENGRANGVDIEWIEGDLTLCLAEHRFDYVVCNPPYVTAREWAELDASVQQYEPKQALEAGVDGLDFYRRLAVELPAHLNSGAKVWLEMGKDQGGALMNLFGKSPWQNGYVSQDWAGHDRFFLLECE